VASEACSEFRQAIKVERARVIGLVEGLEAKWKRSYENDVLHDVTYDDLEYTLHEMSDLIKSIKGGA